MKKSLFKKFYLTYLSIMMVGFILLGILVLGFSGNYWMQENTNMLTAQARTVVGQIEGGSVIYRGDWLYDYVYQVTDLMCQASHCQVLVVDNKGFPQVVVGDSIVPKPMSPKVLQLPGQGVHDLDGGLKEDCLVVRQPFVAADGTKGYVFAMVPAGAMGTYLWGLVRLLVISMMIIAALLFVAAYIMASTVVRPLTQMSAAAKSLAKGDFSRRIETTRTDEIGQLAEAFNDMTVSLEAGEKMRRGFVANVSHELKTPMTIIAGFVDGILDGTVPKEREAEYLGIVSGEIKRLSRLINTLLNLSRLESGEFTLHPTNLDLTQNIVSASLMFESAVTEKELTLAGLDSLPPLPTRGDSDLLHQVVYNLMDNAVKYTPQGGEILYRGWQEQERIHFALRNTGKGISEEHLPFIFDRFYKADQSRGQDKNSLGLGLYLTKTIVNHHGGTITVRSVEDAFTEFEVVLPIN